MYNLCVIPARGGSKRILRKNIKLFNGKPMISYAIDTALKSGIFDKVLVSTDDNEIRDISISLGASVPFLRSSENSDDNATTFNVLKEVINMLEIDNNRDIDSLCCIYPCSPLIRHTDLILAYKFFLKSKSDSLIPVLNYSHPIQRALSLDNKKNLTMINRENYKKRTQDLKETYYDAGQFYFFKPSVIKDNTDPFSSSVVGYKLDPLFAQDIDNESDWKIAELKHKVLNEIS